MVSKKKKRIILISILSVVLVAVIAVSSIFIVKNNKNKKSSNVPTAEQVGQTDTNGSNKAILDKKVSANYHGIYVFSNIKDIEFSDELNATEIRALFKNKNVSNKNELFDLLKKEKVSAANDKGELIVIYNGNINETIGKGDEATTVSGSEGTFVGDDNLSLVTITSTKEEYYISLNYKSKDLATTVSEESSADGTKLYVFKKIYSKYDPSLVLIDITYEYNLLVIEEEIDESIYDF